MAFSINKAYLVGNVTADPELKYTPKGTATLNLGVATNHSYKDGDEWKEVPSFHRVQIWGKQAEFIAGALSKGDKVVVEGRIAYRSYDDKDGNKRYITEIIAENVIPHSGNRSSAPRETEQSEETTIDDFEDNNEDVPQENDKDESVEPDDIPF